MAAIITSNRPDAICAICTHTFSDDQVQYTHVGGEDHDGFHRNCLRDLFRHAVRTNIVPICPIDRTEIQDSLKIGPTRRVGLAAAIEDAAYATFFGLAGAAAGAAAGVGLLGAGAVRGAAVIGATAAVGGALGVGAAMAAGMGVRSAVAAVAAGIGVAAAVPGSAEVGRAIVVAAGGAAAAGVVAGAAVGASAGVPAAVAARIIAMVENRYVGNFGGIRIQNIFPGVFLGACTMMVFTPNQISGLLAIPTIALISGVVAGVLSFIRR